ncbi:hypothetical protein ACIQZO_31130 [Streptomyces sp. NPDC097617]|uniref:hypothetical protein n=1 Tax=Streptomyces sp. NPDC097617 TaxID=3366091 RepID=UPI00382340A5
MHPAPYIAKSGPDATETPADSSVDDGEIRWTDRTGYEDAFTWAVTKWQYPGSHIKIVARTGCSPSQDVDEANYRKLWG